MKIYEPSTPVRALMHRNCLTDLVREFESIYQSEDYINPPKISIPLRTDSITNEYLDYANTMVAYHKEWHCVKHIVIDKEGLNSSSMLQLYKQTKLVGSIHFLDLTRLRCAVLTLMLVDKIKPNSIGLIGLGRINATIIKALSIMYPNIKINLYGEYSNAQFEEYARSIYGIDFDSNEHLVSGDYVINNYNALSMYSDLIITSTSASYDAKMISCLNRYICFDSGYIVAPEVRMQTPVYFDNIEQAELMNKDGDEFPRDNHRLLFSKALPLVSNLDKLREEAYSIYLEGMAIFDLILARYHSGLYNMK